MRTELKKKRKIYFWDNGIRNAVLQNFSPLELRQDRGALWENFIVSERMKHNSYFFNNAHIYFWRTTTQQEIDYIEEKDGALDVYEMKFNPKQKASLPSLFSQNYPVRRFEVITPDNYLPWVVGAD